MNFRLIKLTDVNVQGMQVHIRNGKGRKQPYVGLSVFLSQKLPVYLNEVKAVLYLFEGLTPGQPMAGHGDNPEAIGNRIEDVKQRREKLGLPAMTYGVAAYSIIRNSEQEVKKELERITNVNASAAGYNNYHQWLKGTQLEKRVSLEDYSVSNRGLRTGLTGTPEQVAEKVYEFEKAGVDFFLLQCSPQLEEMERFSEVIADFQLV